MKGKHNVVHPDVDGRIILKWNLKCVGVNSSASGQEPVAARYHTRELNFVLHKMRENSSPDTRLSASPKGRVELEMNRKK
jgi:hypothetical protein